MFLENYKAYFFCLFIEETVLHDSPQRQPDLENDNHSPLSANACKDFVALSQYVPPESIEMELDNGLAESTKHSMVSVGPSSTAESKPILAVPNKPACEIENAQEASNSTTSSLCPVLENSGTFRFCAGPNEQERNKNAVKKVKRQLDDESAEASKKLCK